MLLKERDGERLNIEAEWRRIYKETRRIFSPRSAPVPDYLRTWEEYRKNDEAVLRALGALCDAAIAMNPDFTVEITADDFRLLRKFY